MWYTLRTTPRPFHHCSASCTLVGCRFVFFFLYFSACARQFSDHFFFSVDSRCFFLFSVRHYCLYLCYNRANSHCIDYGCCRCCWLCILRYYLIHRRLLVFWLRFLGTCGTQNRSFCFRRSRRWNCESRSGLNAKYDAGNSIFCALGKIAQKCVARLLFSWRRKWFLPIICLCCRMGSGAGRPHETSASAVHKKITLFLSIP